MTFKLIGNNIIRLKETDSTNRFALNLINEKRPAEGTLIIASNQTHGKGLETNTWESEPGKNLTFTIILYPGFLPIDKQFELNKVIALGVCDFIRQKVPDQKVSIKWPNDIYIGDRKTAGILIQNSIIGNRFDYVIAGIGMNINQENFSPALVNPVSIKNFTKKEYLLDEELNSVSLALNFRYTQFLRKEFETIDDNYLQALYRYREWHNFELEGRIREARITGISGYGHLILAARDETIHECGLKEVRFIP